MSEPCTKDKNDLHCSATVTALYNRRSYEFVAMADIHKKSPA